MKRLITKVLLFAGTVCPFMVSANGYWQQVDAAKAPKDVQILHPNNYMVYTMNEPAVKLQLWSLSTDPAEGMIMSLPMPNGGFRDFKVWQTPMMDEAMQAKYPDIKTFSGEAVGNRTITAKIEFTLFGFSAMIYDGANTSLIDPYDNYHDGFYMVHYKRDEVRTENQRMKCEVHSDGDKITGVEQMAMQQNTLPALAQRTSNGYNLRTYRLALSADHFYCQTATGVSSPTIAACLSKMTVTMNRVNGVYNRDFSVQMNFCSNEDTLIWPTNTGSVNGNDPFNSIDNNGGACLSQNQTTVTARIGSANYDVGHVFTTGGGGISSLGVVCNNSMKAQSCTGSPMPVNDAFDIDYVAHEMGHEFGSEHTFNDNTNGSCGGNAVSFCAYEPGSGATIMDYAGICTGDDLQQHSDPYFSASSLVQIQTKLAGSENTCAVITSTGNKLVSLAPFTASYTIPYKTPFELIGPTAVDSVADTAITYGWAQWNLGDFGKTFATVFLKGPIARSYNPAYTPTRVVPKLSTILTGATNTNAGEKAPDTARYMTFKMVVRNIINGTGCFLFPDDTVHIDAVSTGATNAYAGFKVTSQSTTGGVSYPGGSTQTVTWNVVGTDAAPVNAANVKIYMSKDNGNTWPYLLGTFPNTGTASVTVPNPAATVGQCRFKVKGDNNIFFNINKVAFTVTNNPAIGITGVQTATAANDINIYPVPASELINVSANGTQRLDGVIYNTAGQAMWQGQINGLTTIAVRSWAPGVYYARFTDATTGSKTVKSFVIQ